MDRYYFHHTRRILYIQKMLIIRPGFMKFKGYWHEEESNFPIETLFYCGDDVYWIRIDSKKQYDMDTSGSFYDEGIGGNICLFPSYIVELEFTVLAKNMSKEKYSEILEEIKEDNRILEQREYGGADSDSTHSSVR